MSKASQLIETSAFSERLRLALKGVGIRPSPTLVANEFNLRYWGNSITSHTARNWLLGKSIPTQDKLRVLADWLHVSPDELRYGTLAPTFKAQDSGTDMTSMNMQDRDMLARYMTLSLENRKTVCDVVVALAVAATVKPRDSKIKGT
jgi:transcriptional regulator with XRE-family HTH domain